MLASISELPPHRVFDFCIIGSGPAGITVALRLEATGKSVALLEGGGEHPVDLSQNLYQGGIIGDPYFDLTTCRLRFFGGTSNHWAGWCRPLEEEDFLPKAAAPLTEWPIRKQNLDPYLVESREILGLEPFQDNVPLTGSGLEKVQYNYSAPVRFRERYGNSLAGSKNINVFFNTNVTALRTDGNMVSAIDVSDLSGGNLKTIRAGTYVLATGGIENSRLLLWSNLLAGGKLIRNDGTLGRYWMEHPQYVVGDALLTGLTQFNTDHQGLIHLTPTKDSLADDLTLNCGLRVRPDSPATDTKELIADMARVAPDLAKQFEDLVHKGLAGSARIHTAWEQEPRADNRVTLSTSKDRLGIPSVVLHWEKSGLDHRTPRLLVNRLARWLAESNAGRVRLRDWIRHENSFPEGNRRVEGIDIAGNHHMGGTRMAASPRYGIVDRNCKVFDQDNLYVAGSSVFPSGGYVPPTLTIVQLASRLGDHLSNI